MKGFFPINFGFFLQQTFFESFLSQRVSPVSRSERRGGGPLEGELLFSIAFGEKHFKEISKKKAEIVFFLQRMKKS
jgi:hypothetical protein